MKNSTINKEELFEKTKDAYVSSNGIIITRTFSENGIDINEAFQNHLKRCLEDHRK